MHGWHLTPRERMVILSFAVGMTGQQTAEVLGIKYQTVKTLSSRARMKLGAKTTTHAVYLAMKEGIIQ